MLPTPSRRSAPQPQVVTRARAAAARSQAAHPATAQANAAARVVHTGHVTRSYTRAVASATVQTRPAGQPALAARVTRPVRAVPPQPLVPARDSAVPSQRPLPPQGRLFRELNPVSAATVGIPVGVRAAGNAEDWLGESDLTRTARS